MKTFEINKRDYYNKNDIEIIIIDTKVVEPIIKKTVLTVQQILEKIERIKVEKNLIIERYDSEIKELQDFMIEAKVDEVTILKGTNKPTLSPDN